MLLDDDAADAACDAAGDRSSLCRPPGPPDLNEFGFSRRGAAFHRRGFRCRGAATASASDTSAADAGAAVHASFAMRGDHAGRRLRTGDHRTAFRNFRALICSATVSATAISVGASSLDNGLFAGMRRHDAFSPFVTRIDRSAFGNFGVDLLRDRSSSRRVTRLSRRFGC